MPSKVALQYVDVEYRCHCFPNYLWGTGPISANKADIVQECTPSIGSSEVALVM